MAQSKGHPVYLCKKTPPSVHLALQQYTKDHSRWGSSWGKGKTMSFKIPLYISQYML